MSVARLVLALVATTAILFGLQARPGAGAAGTESWSDFPSGRAPAARQDATVVWTGTEMIVWGGESYTGALDDGARLNMATGRWSTMSKVGAPSKRSRAPGIWTGNEMIVWGGTGGSGQALTDGARYNPSTDTWTPITTVNAPGDGTFPTLVWTGSEVIAWGGIRPPGGTNAIGARYNPSTDTWTPMSTVGEPAARGAHSAVWTGTEMIVWGGAGSSFFSDGGRYNPTTDSWTPITALGAPLSRFNHSAVWTGTEMIVWGGHGYGGTDRATGGRYNPATDSWSSTSMTGVPEQRAYHSAVWTGTEMIVWGGDFCAGSPNCSIGGRYNSATDTWTQIPTTNAPTRRERHATAWTGSDMLVWGGDGNGSDFGGYLRDGARFDPASGVWSAIDTIDEPHQSGSTAVWTGTEMILLRGTYSGPIGTGDGRYNPTTDTWTPISTTNAPGPRIDHTVVWTGTEAIVWGGSDYERAVQFDDGGRYNPTTGTWTPVSKTNAPTPRTNHTAVWTGSEMLVWGGRSSGCEPATYCATGSRYNPAIDSWAPMSTMNAPKPRLLHTAVWTGTEMIVWGGQGAQAPFMYGYLIDGGRYNPATDTWTSTSLTNVPLGRIYHSMIWTGSEAIVWGGSADSKDLSEGARYRPATDTWTKTSEQGAPSARGYHSAFWTGTEMIVWGGLRRTEPIGMPELVENGGLYDPQTDSWRSGGIVAAPQMSGSGGVWTGTELILWGGNGVNGGGARYRPAERPTATPTHTTTPIHTSTPTRTPLPVAPTGVPTAAVVVPTALPTSIPTPNAATGGRAVVLPTVAAGATAVAVIQPGPGAPFEMTLVVPAPAAGTPSIGVRVQPSTLVDAGVALPSGATVAKVISIDVFDAATGALIHDHAQPLDLAIQLTDDEAAVCASDPGRLALLHIDAIGTVTRVAPSRLDCANRLLFARLDRTSSYAVGTLRSSTDIMLRLFVPMGLRNTQVH